MGLFDRKRTNFDIATPYYTIGASGTVLIVGLGNPGDKYAKTRHNAGFMALDLYQTTQDFTGWTLKKDLKAMIATAQVGNTRIIIAKPTTFMNESGQAVQALQQFYKINNEDTVVVYDELDVDFGAIRTRNGGGSAGHNGIKSVTKHCGESYGRIRIGIGPKKPAQIDSADFVLQDFTKDHQANMHKILKEACTFIDERTVGPLTDHSINVL